MDTVEELRKALDAIDDRLIAVLNERFAVSKRMATLKRDLGLPPIDAAREQAIITRLLGQTNPADWDTVEAVYERIFGGSRGFIETIARGIAIRDGKVLLCRAKGGATSYLPGGHIEFGETGEVALKREIKEELGIDCTVGAMLGTLENSFLQHGKKHCEINLIYRMELSDDASTPRACEDWIEFEWCSLDNLEAAKVLPSSIVEYIVKAV